MDLSDDLALEVLCNAALVLQVGRAREEPPEEPEFARTEVHAQEHPEFAKKETYAETDYHKNCETSQN